jgi:hypothetical protein
VLGGDLPKAIKRMKFAFGKYNIALSFLTLGSQSTVIRKSGVGGKFAEGEYLKMEFSNRPWF